MMTSETKWFIFAGAGIASLIAIPTISDQINKRRDAKKELELAKIVGEYPSEYWVAKQAEADADAEVKKAQIESDERLKLDERNRAEAEAEKLREFEKDAPAEYWEQKRIESEAKAKMEIERERCRTEEKVAKLHRDTVADSARAAERAVIRGINAFSSDTNTFDLFS